MNKEKCYQLIKQDMDSTFYIFLKYGYQQKIKIINNLN